MTEDATEIPKPMPGRESPAGRARLVRTVLSTGDLRKRLDALRDCMQWYHAPSGYEFWNDAYDRLEREECLQFDAAVHLRYILSALEDAAKKS